LPDSANRRPRVVIIGGGFGGLYAARALARAPVQVTLLDRTNHHLFQPLLYQVATGALAASEIAHPIRFLLRRQRNVEVLLAEAERIDPDEQVVLTRSGGRFPYDYLIISAGSRHAYFGHADWEPLAPGLKTMDDALEIRRRFLLAFERSERAATPEERDAWLTFAIVGGGPTGVELAGIMPGIARRGMRPDYRRTDLSRIRVVLVEAGPRVLATYSDDSSERAERDLCALGVEVRTGAPVSSVSDRGVVVKDELIPARTVFWAAGNVASPLLRSTGAELDRAGRSRVTPELNLPRRAELFVIGDCAIVPQPDGSMVPGVAPAAMQQGRAAARNIQRAIEGRELLPFKYRNKGDLATIGRSRAIAEFGRFHISGRIAWFLWLFVHILYLAGFRNRVIVLMEWAYAYFTYRPGARLISEADAVRDE
jgi:NADH dehydrogenase